MSVAPSEPIVFFDGVCGLCNGFVDRLMRWDTHRTLRYATLQGSTARRTLPDHLTTGMDTIVYQDEQGLHTRSDAALRIISRLGGGWRLLAPLRWIPRTIRDAVYDLIAKNRYGWFGKRETCRIPTVEERALFLD